MTKLCQVGWIPLPILVVPLRQQAESVPDHGGDRARGRMPVEVTLVAVLAVTETKVGTAVLVATREVGAATIEAEEDGPTTTTLLVDLVLQVLVVVGQVEPLKLLVAMVVRGAALGVVAKVATVARAVLGAADIVIRAMLRTVDKLPGVANGVDAKMAKGAKVANVVLGVEEETVVAIRGGERNVCRPLDEWPRRC